MRSIALFLVAVMMSGAAYAQHVQIKAIRNAEITMLRVHDVGTKFGGGVNEIDVEVVITLAGVNGAFGFRLRDDANRPVREGMLDLLRDAMSNDDLLVNIDYAIDPEFGRVNGTIRRVWLTRSGS